MKVKALEAGFYNGNRVRQGQEFEVPEGTKGKWFVALAEVKATESPKAKGKKAEPQTLSEAAHQDVQGFNEALNPQAESA